MVRGQTTFNLSGGVPNTECIAARADLYGKIAEQTEGIRNARKKLRKLLEED